MAPKFALFTKGSKLPLNQGFQNRFLVTTVSRQALGMWERVNIMFLCFIGQGSGSRFSFQIFDENQSSSQNKNSKPSAMPFAIFDENQGRQEKQNAPKTTVPFTIFEENKESCQTKKPSAVPFTVFQDGENDTR